MQDGYRRNPHFLAHHDRACPLVDHHPRRPVGFHSDFLQLRNELDGQVRLRHIHADQRRILGSGKARPRRRELLIHGRGHARGSREIGLAKLQPDLHSRRNRRRGAFHNRTVRHASDGGMVCHYARARTTFGREAIDHHRTLRNRIHLSVGPA